MPITIRTSGPGFVSTETSPLGWDAFLGRWLRRKHDATSSGDKVVVDHITKDSAQIHHMFRLDWERIERIG